MEIILKALIVVVDTIILSLGVIATCVGLTTSSETLRKGSIGFLAVILVILIISR